VAVAADEFFSGRSWMSYLLSNNFGAFINFRSLKNNSALQLSRTRDSSISIRFGNFLSSALGVSSLISSSYHKSAPKMVEGHQCHRVAHFHRQKLVDKRFSASSPNGRFIDGARAIDQQPLQKIEVHGKNLFYFFGNVPNSHHVVHIHFGMSGAFSIHNLNGDGQPREAKATTRLQLIDPTEGLVAHLSAMTVKLGDVNFYESKSKELGEDPLRTDANPEAAWDKIRQSKKPVGLLLMDQSVIAGVGNIYRAEILFKAGIHPEQPGYTLRKEEFDLLWHHSVDLLHRGFQTGSILTVDPEEACVLGSPWTRRYTYNQSRCGRCKSPVKTWEMAARTVYCCGGTCQLLRLQHNNEPVKMIPDSRKKAMKAARQAVEFVSHCASDDDHDSGIPLERLTLAILRIKAEAAGLSAKGKKTELIARLKAGMKPAVDEDSLIPTPEPAERTRRRFRTSLASSIEPDSVYPETYQWDHQLAAGQVASAKEAAQEKKAAGEGANVEHVAYHDEEEEKVVRNRKVRRQQRCLGSVPI